MSLRTLSAALLLATAACQSADVRPPPRIALTHQWSAPAGAALFVQNNLGSDPTAAADALMATMPTLVYRVGERCKADPTFAVPGALTVELALAGGQLRDVRMSSDSSGATCIQAALVEESAASREALAAAGTAQIVLFLKHAPAPAAEPPPPVG